MSRAATILLIAAVLVILSNTGLAEDDDVVILKEGGMYKGKIISQSGGTVKMKVKGRIITINKRDIRKIIAKERPEAEYKRRAKATGKKDAEAHFELALWCLDQGLEKEADQHLKTVIKLEPDHAGAREALGFGFYEGEWRTFAELEEKGLVLFEDLWIDQSGLEAAKIARRDRRLAGLDAACTTAEKSLDGFVEELGHTFRSLKVQGDFVYPDFERDRNRLFIVREPLVSPLGLPALGREVMESLRSASGKPAATLAFLVERGGAELGVEDFNLGWSPPGEAGNNLYAALWSLCDAGGAPLDQEGKETLRARAERVPVPFRDGLAALVNCFTRACLLRKAAFREVIIKDLEGILSLENYGEQEKMLDTVDFAKEVSFMEHYPLLAKSAETLMEGIDAFVVFARNAELSAGVAQRSVILEADTPFGKILVGGKGDHHYEEDVALLVDLGGNDTYQASLASSRAAEGGVALLIDLAGDDEYIAKAYGAFGYGYFGVGILYDRSGNDRYSSVGYALGSAYMGCGLLLDGAGDDSYECGTCGQGWGLFGYGLLIDQGGEDRYQIGKAGQGYGGTLGIGLLLDLDGNDTYRAGGGMGADALDPQASACFAQGAARGHREDPEGEESPGDLVSGGWGILADLAGNDGYEADSYAQGSAQWSGLGMLLDRCGDDTFTGNTLAQGAGFGLGSGLLLDVEGDDRYTISAMGQGCAMNFSVGALMDCYGKDEYEGDQKSLGYAFALNGLGLFLDLSGNDRYLGSESSFGRSEGFDAPEGAPFRTLGLFMDLGGGKDGYRGRSDARDGGRWLQDDQNGAGLDR